MPSSTTTANPNPYVLAAENNQTLLLPLLRAQPSLVNTQDTHGYSLLHAAASYGHIDLLRQLATTFKGDVNLRDTDGETALFQTERVDVARVLVEELGADISIQNDEGMTAAEKLEAEAEEGLEVAAYLRDLEEGAGGAGGGSRPPPPAQLGFRVVSRREQVGSGNDGEDGVVVVDDEVRRRIERLAEREDFSAEEGQRELRSLVADVVRGHVVGSSSSTTGDAAAEQEEERDRTRRRVG